MKYDIEKHGLLNHDILLLATAYVPAVNKMLSLCAMAKECDIFSFELLSNMLNLHWNGDVFNQGFVIFSRTGVLHACLSPKGQTLTTLAAGEKLFLFRVHLKDYNPGRIIWETK